MSLVSVGISRLRVLDACLQLSRSVSGFRPQRLLSSLAIQRNREALGLGPPTRPRIPLGARSPQTLEAELVSPENKVHTTQIVSLCEAGDFDGARRLFESIQEKNSIVWGALLSGAVRNRKFHQGTHLFEKLRASGVQLTEPIYVSGMSLYSGCKRFEEAFALFQEMRTSGIAQNVPPFAVAMRACGQMGDYEKARVVWADMLSHGLRPINATFSNIIGAAADAGNSAAAEAHLREMYEHSLSPDQNQFGCLLKAYRNERDITRAETLLEEMVARGVMPTVLHYTTAISIYRLTGLASTDPARALQAISAFVERMLARGVVPDKYFFEEHLAALLGSPLEAFIAGSFSPHPQALDAARALPAPAGLDLTQLARRAQLKLQNYATNASENDAGLWLEALDPSSGRSYYYHEVTREVSWTRPA